MKTLRSLLLVVPLLAFLPAAEQNVAQGQSIGGQSQNGTFRYTRKNVSFDVAGKKKPVEGTLTLPRSSRPSAAILFVTGAWTENRDGLGETEQLRALADYLGEHGIAVLQLRMPLGGRSTSDLESATSATFETDIQAGLAYLKQRPEIDPKQIGLFGQNENGAIATVTASLNPDVSFLILSGTPVIEYGPAARSTNAMNAYDLRPTLERISCPVLVLQGDQDKSMPLRENMNAYRSALAAGNNRNAAFMTLPGLNRTLQTTTGKGRSESEMAPLAMRTVAHWVDQRNSGANISDNLALNGDTEEKVRHRKDSNPFGDVPGGVIGQFRYRRDMLWVQPIGGQQRPYGYWYW